MLHADLLVCWCASLPWETAVLMMGRHTRLCGNVTLDCDTMVIVAAIGDGVVARTPVRCGPITAAIESSLPGRSADVPGYSSNPQLVTWAPFKYSLPQERRSVVRRCARDVVTASSAILSRRRPSSTHGKPVRPCAGTCGDSPRLCRRCRRCALFSSVARHAGRAPSCR